MRAVAFVPARGGSKRVPRKALRPLGGHPLIWWTLDAAYRAGLKTVMATDDEEIARVAHAATPDPDWSIFMRDPSPDDEPDIVWVQKALAAYPDADPFLILRPTSPFRGADCIARALRTWRQVDGWADSLRSMIVATEHPAKMWVYSTYPNYPPGELRPVMSGEGVMAPWHSSPTQTLPIVYKQTAGLEIAHRATVTERGSIAGLHVVPFFMTPREAIDINREDDFAEAERVIESMATA